MDTVRKWSAWEDCVCRAMLNFHWESNDRGRLQRWKTHVCYVYWVEGQQEVESRNAEGFIVPSKKGKLVGLGQGQNMIIELLFTMKEARWHLNIML